MNEVTLPPACRAAGLLLLATAACASRSPLEGANLDALGAIAAQVESQRLEQRINELSTSHASDTPVDCSKLGAQTETLCHLTRGQAGALMQRTLGSLGLAAQRQELTGVSVFPTTNVIAELPGVSRPEEIILVGAHFDAFYMGADDNSTGVAAVLELARVLSQYKFDRTLRFVGFDLEELGLIGSERYVNALAGERVTAAIVFDCIGYYDSTPGSQSTLPGLPAPSEGDFLAVIGNDLSSAQAAEVYALNDALKLMHVVPLLSGGNGASPLGGQLMRSDHTPFWLKDQKALFLTDTANFRNPNYHQASDTIETLSFPLLTKAVQVSAVSLAYWAGGPR